MRTRLLDNRGKIPHDNVFRDEKQFLDLLVDAQFISNEPFNEIEFSAPGSDSLAKSVLLKSVKSSKLSMGLYAALSNVFADRGAIGLFTKFTISTQVGSDDIFCRLTFGMRLENRSELRLSGASAQLGITANKAAGSLQRGKVFAFDRVVLDFELPLTARGARRGLFVQFHGEWPINSKNKIPLEGTREQKEIAPPIYQFRLGATFDPVDLFGPMFGLAN
jgi:hypothetical protein